MGGLLKLNKLINFIFGIADGLNTAYNKCITHKDIKAENIIINKTGQVNILDFDLTKQKG